MKITKKGQSGTSEISNQTLGEMVRAALLKEHVGMSAPLRHIARNTGISYSTVGKWYKHGYAPKSNHLLIIASHYPQVMQLLLERMGVGILWGEVERAGIIEPLRMNLDKNRNKSSTIGDKFVTIRVRIDAGSAIQLNQRQLWFLGQLQQGYIMSGRDLIDTWTIHPRTAKRDIAEMIKAKLLRSVRQGKCARYELR